MNSKNPSSLDTRALAELVQELDNTINETFQISNLRRVLVAQTKAMCDYHEKRDPLYQIQNQSLLNQAENHQRLEDLNRDMEGLSPEEKKLVYEAADVLFIQQETLELETKNEHIANAFREGFLKKEQQKAHAARKIAVAALFSKTLLEQNIAHLSQKKGRYKKISNEFEQEFQKLANDPKNIDAHQRLDRQEHRQALIDDHEILELTGSRVKISAKSSTSSSKTNKPK